MAHRFPEFAAQGVSDHFLCALELLVQAHLKELTHSRLESEAAKVLGVFPVSASRVSHGVDESVHLLRVPCQNQDACLEDLDARGSVDSFFELKIADCEMLGEIEGEDAFAQTEANLSLQNNNNHNNFAPKKISRLTGNFQVVDSEAGKDVDLMLSTRNYGRSFLSDEPLGNQKNKGLMARIVEHPKFDMVFSFLIILNTVTLVVEAQYDGFELGHKLGIAGFSRPDNEEQPSLYALDFFFGISFTVELLFKLFALRLQFWLQPWNLFDTFIMLTWILGKLFQGLEENTNPTMLRLLRLLKIMRIVRLFKSMNAMDSLLVLVKSIRASLAAFFWSCCLICVMVTLVALTVHSFLQAYFSNDSEPVETRQMVFKYFGTFSLTAVSMFEAILGNFAPVMRKLTLHVDEGWSIFFIIYKLVGGFPVITVITGVFLQETFKVANSDDDLMLLKHKRQATKHMKKMTRLFESADDKPDERGLDWKTFYNLLNDPEINSWLAAYDFEVGDVKMIFDLMDDGDGRITVEELMTGVSRLKGWARSIDLHVMLHQVKENRKCLDQLRRDVRFMHKSMRQ